MSANVLRTIGETDTISRMNHDVHDRSLGKPVVAHNSKKLAAARLRRAVRGHFAISVRNVLVGAAKFRDRIRDSRHVFRELGEAKKLLDGEVSKQAFSLG